MKKILITGASGFIGSFIVEEALRRELEVWAAVRPTSSRKYLQDTRIRFIELDFRSEEKLTEQLRGHDFDYIVHAAGATKCLHREDFFRTNTEGTKHLVRAILRLSMPIEKFVYLSSLSVFGPICEQQPYREILESDTPHPNTAYGESKLQAEKWLENIGKRREERGERRENTCIKGVNDENKTMNGEDKGTSLTSHLSPLTSGNDSPTSDTPPTGGQGSLPYVILRPTGVYGPRERDYFLMAKTIKNHTDFAVGYKQQDITFVYVKDLVQAVFLALERGRPGRKYFISDGKAYQSSTFSRLVRRELGSPWWIRLTVPVWGLRVVTFFGEYIGRLTGTISALNNDKYNIMKQRNWRCDISPAVKELGYAPQYDLERGVKETIKWYKDNEWL